MKVLARGRAFLPAVVSILSFILLLSSLSAVAPLASAEAPARLRIKNGRGITIALGKTREAATGIRPDKQDKKAWALELDPSFVGAEADLRDVTPDVAGARWSVPVTTARLVLDGARFLPDHVYRIELRRDRQALGAALVYLYPPPAERVTRVNLDDKPAAGTDDIGFAPLPKGRL
jgi:hypothetical protein